MLTPQWSFDSSIPVELADRKVCPAIETVGRRSVLTPKTIAFLFRMPLKEQQGRTVSLKFYMQDTKLYASEIRNELIVDISGDMNNL